MSEGQPPGAIGGAHLPSSTRTNPHLSVLSPARSARRQLQLQRHNVLAPSTAESVAPKPEAPIVSARQLRLQARLDQLPPERVQELQDAFNMFDVDGTGQIDYRELKVSANRGVPVAGMEETHKAFALTWWDVWRMRLGRAAGTGNRTPQG